VKLPNALCYGLQVPYYSGASSALVERFFSTNGKITLHQRVAALLMEHLNDL
jgi:hypothetical protein